MNIEPRLGVVNLKNTEQHAVQAHALRKRIYRSKFDSAELVAGCGWLVLK
jgi:hypothetical protein